MRDSTRTTRPPSTNTVARKRLGSVNVYVAIDLPSTVRVPACALLRSAARRTPYGVIQSWCRRSTTKRGPGAGLPPATFQA